MEFNFNLHYTFSGNTTNFLSGYFWVQFREPKQRHNCFVRCLLLQANFDVLYKVVYYCVYQCSYFLQNFAIFRLKFSTFWFSIAFFVCNIFSTCKTKTNINAKFSGRTWYFLLKQSFIWLLHNLCYCTYKEGGPKTFFKKSL